MLLEWECDLFCCRGPSCHFAELPSPVGKAISEMPYIMIERDHSNFSVGQLSYQWKFKLDKLLRINITLNYIYFSAIDRQKCNFGNLKVYDSRFTYQYCGMYSEVTLYLESQIPQVVIHLLPFVAHEALSSFSVIGVKSFRSIHLSQRVIDGTAPLSNKWVLVENGLGLPAFSETFLKITVELQMFAGLSLNYQVYHVVVSKLLVMDIKCQLHILLPIDLYEGPEKAPEHLLALLPELQKSKAKLNVTLRTKSFQFVMYVFTSMWIGTAPTVSYRTVKSEMPKRVIIHGPFYAIAYPEHYSSCLKNIICFLQVETYPGFKFNISIRHFEHTGKNNTEKCSYAGLSVHERDTEISCICAKMQNLHETAKYSSPHFLFQNIYSSHNTVLLTIFSYKLFANISFLLNITSTPCKVVDPAVVCGHHRPAFVISGTQDFVHDMIELSSNRSQCVIFQFAQT